MSSHHYDKKAAVYDDSLNVLTYAAHAEEPTYRAVLGDLRGLDVLDLGSGTGIWTRRIKVAGAGRVVGLEISPGMNEVARLKEDEHPLGITYQVGDAATVDAGQWAGQFDVVSAINVLHYSATRQELAGMCATAATALKSGGRLIATCANWDISPDSDYYTPYGFRVELPSPRRDGGLLTAHATMAGRPVSIEVYLWQASVYEKILKDSGFTDVRWHPWRISPKGIAEYGEAYWERFTDRPPMLLLEATR